LAPGSPARPNDAPLAKKRLLTLPLVARECIGRSYHVLTFADPEATVVAPGQFAMVRGAEWGDAPLLPRPMSYLTGGEHPSILIKVVGEGTRRMGRADPPEPFLLLGPLGTPWRAHDPARSPLLVAGGVGIAPILFLARELFRLGTRAVCVYGGRTAHDLPLLAELEQVSTVHVTTEDGTLGVRGRVTDVLGSLVSAHSNVYTCGPNAMMAAVAAQAKAAGAACEASLETPMGCGYGVCLGCPVPMQDNRFSYACVEGPCLDAEHIDWPRLLSTKAHAKGST
jgi:dihydroorotate dehydrogenase electron transfer subunit